MLVLLCPGCPHLGVNPGGVGRRCVVCSDASDEMREAAAWVALHEEDETSK